MAKTKIQKKPKIRKKQFHYKLYRSSVILVYGPEHTCQELFDYAAKLDPELNQYREGGYDWSQVAAMACEPTSKRKIYVLVGVKTDIFDLVHECSHVTHYLFQGIGSQHTADSDENYAYTLDNVLEDLYQYIVKYTDDEKLIKFLRTGPK